MISAKFKVGEEVVLQSITHPEFNGEYIVSEVLIGQMSRTCRVTGRKVFAAISIGYLLDEPFFVESEGIEGLVEECELKKKYKPGDSFELMIEKLNDKEFSAW